MSVVSSVLSTRSSGWKINARFASLMDSVFAIGFGLGLRFVVDLVSHHDFKLTGTLVGLWEGIIMLHFLKKMPKSSDPYVGYAVRLFVDFLCTESVARLVLVLIWTGLGMVLADITPALWDDVGLNRIWRRFRRDIYTISRMIPTVAFFPPPRTVRFSPSREHSIIIEEPSVLEETQTSSIITSDPTPTTPQINTGTTTTTPAAREILKRRVPGYFPGDYSDTDTDLGSVRAGPPPGRTSRRLSIYPQHDYDESVTDGLSSNNDLDEANLSSGASSASTERGEQSVLIDTVDIPDMEDEQEQEQEVLVVDTAAVPVKNEEGETTPRAGPSYLPPTPSDSAAHWRKKIDPDEPLPVRPRSEFLPQIPDFLDEPTTEDWENIQPQEYADKPPTPPAKDDLPARYTVVPPPPTISPPPPPTAAVDDAWETVKAEFVAPNTNDTDKRRSEPPSYKESAEFDDIYGDEYAGDEYVPEQRYDEHVNNDFYDNGLGGSGVPPATNLIDADDNIPPPTLGAPFTFGQGESRSIWDDTQAPPRDSFADFIRQQAEDEARLKAQEEAEREQAIGEEEARVGAEIAQMEKEREEEEEERQRQQEEELRWKAERKRKEEEDELARQKKREEEAAEREREEEEKKAAEELKRAEELAVAEAEAKAAKKADKKKKKEEEKKAAEAEAARVAAEEQKAKDDVKAQRKKDAAEAAARRQEAAEQKRIEEEAADKERERQEQEAEEQRKREEEAELARIAQAAVELALEEEKFKQEEEQKAQEADAAAKAAAEAEQAPVEPAPQDETSATPKTSDIQLDGEQIDLLATPKHAPQELNVTEHVETSHIDPEAQDVDNAGGGGDTHDAPGSPAVAESIITDASEMPTKVADRLERLILGKAQMVEIRDIIDKLRQKLEDPSQDAAAISGELQRSEKVLKKMERKEARRHADGLKEHFYLDENDHSDTLTFNATVPPKDAGLKIEERLEEMMKPGITSLELSISVAPVKKPNGPKQKNKLTQLLSEYSLLKWAKEDPKNGRITNVKITENEFRDWLATYRKAQSSKDDDDGWN